MIQFAIKYAEMGFHIFPLKPGQKIPLTPHGCLDATTDLTKIKGWWAKWPNANIGVATGSSTGVCIVDVDGMEGHTSMVSIGLRSTVSVKTGNGSQLYFRSPMVPLRNSVRKVAPGIDIRGEGGYGILPPSLHPNGKRYSWQTFNASLTSLPKFPSVLVDTPSILANVTDTRNKQGWIADALEGMKHGNIDDTLFRVCSKLRSQGYTEADALTLLTPHAQRAGATAGHLSDKVRNVWSRYPASQVTDTKASGIAEFLEDQQEVEWIAKPFIAKKSIGFVAGLPETLKTWLLLDLALEMSRQCGKWLACFPVTTGRVLFIDQERFKGETQRRLNALIVGKGLGMSDLDNLFVKCGTSIKLNIDSSFNAFRDELLDLRPDLVLIDSFATFHNGDENNRMEIQKVLDRLKGLRDEIGCSFVFINHESKSVFSDAQSNESASAFRMVGSVGIVAASEFVLTVRKIEAGKSMVHHTKSTLATAAQSFVVEIKDLDNGGITVSAIGAEAIQ